MQNMTKFEWSESIVTYCHSFKMFLYMV